MSKSDSRVFSLLGQRRFLPFFLTQFLGAFNDNVFKNTLIILIAFKSAQTTSVSADILTNLSAGLFILPFFLFSATAGQLIEKYEKAASIRYIKLLEVFIMLAAAVALYLGSLYWLIALLFLMGLQSSLFGPAKYSYIPQHVSQDELVAANALVQSGTFIAILVGTMTGGLLIAMEQGERAVAVAVVTLALAGYLAARAIPPTPSHNRELQINWNPFTETWRNIGFIRQSPTVFVAVLGISWFWFVGATYLVQLPNYTRVALSGNEQVVTLLLTLFTVGIGVGSLLCHRFSKRGVNFSLVIAGAVGLSLFGIDLFFAPGEQAAALRDVKAFLQHGENLRVVVDVLGLGVSGGLYIVPLFTYVQQQVDASRLSRVIAGNNILNALLMVLSAVLAMLLLGNGMSIAQLFLLVSVINLLVGWWVYLRLRC